ncbi:MAG: hypothetical protein E6Q75_13475 [Rheinheimera sp.]|nr:MAG: hypothetical protein E6Q75_13475 [Rheinheimera sp.]
MTALVSVLPLLRWSLFWLLAVFCGFAAKAGASTQSQFILGIGYGQYSSVLHAQPNRSFNLLPRWQIYYDRFYMENLDLGFNLLETQHWSVDLTTKQSFDALLTRGGGLRDSLLTGLVSTSKPILLPIGHGNSLSDIITPAKRHFSYLGGATVLYRRADWQFSSSVHQDISNVHQGNEWQNSLSYRWQQPGFGVELTGSIRRLDHNYSRYYLGVLPGDFTRNAYQYAPGSQWLPSVKVALRLQLTSQMDFVANWRREYLPSASLNSLYFATLNQDLWFSGVTLRW